MKRRDALKSIATKRLIKNLGFQSWKAGNLLESFNDLRRSLPNVQGVSKRSISTYRRMKSAIRNLKKI